MKNESQYRILLLLKYLLNCTDEDHYISVSDILQFWESKGIQAGRKSVYHDIQLLTDCGLDIICMKSTQNRYFVGSRLFELPELKLLIDAVKSSHFITEKRVPPLLKNWKSSLVSIMQSISTAPYTWTVRLSWTTKPFIML